MAASTYGRYEFWPGPLDAVGNPPANCTIYDQIWEITSKDFELLETDGLLSENMRTWPWDLGAPVIDGDGNPNNYNVRGGDRPELLGDQSLWWIMNDRGNVHEWSQTPPIGLEVHASVFAFQNTNIGGDISFYRYRIINKNVYPLTDAFVSMWVDSDLGNASDDHFGSDSLLHLGYMYNADALDENGYGNAPPAIGYTFLVTPVAPVDELDNDRDGTADEPGESVGMSSAVTFSGGGNSPFGDPFQGEQMYNYMMGLAQNGSPITVGGDGSNFSSEITTFMYSGDPVTGSFWSENRPYMDSTIPPNPPQDRRFMVSGGPFELLSGESTEFVVAVVWAQGKNHLDSVRKLKGIVTNMQASPESFLTSGFRSELASPAQDVPEQVLGFDQNFPNPFRGKTTLRYSLPKTMQVRLSIYNLLGREIEVLVADTQEPGIYSLEFDGSQLPAGIYYARFQVDHLQFTKKTCSNTLIVSLTIPRLYVSKGPFHCHRSTSFSLPLIWPGWRLRGIEI